MKRLVLIILLLTSTTVIVQSADAGTFTVKQCASSGHVDFQGAFSTVNGGGEVHVSQGCTNGGSGWIGIYQDRSGTSLNPGEGGQFIWQTPSGVEVNSSDLTARLKDANGISAQLVGFNGSSITDLDQGVVHDGESRTSRWSNANSPQTMVIARLLCQLSAPCANQPSSVKAFMELTDAEFTARDSIAPSISVSGDLWNWGGDSSFHRGSSSITVDSTDQGTGLAAVWIEVNGLRVDLAAPTCPGDRGSYASRFTPCPLSLTRTGTFDSTQAPFQEGSNQIKACVADYADALLSANKTCSSTRTVLIDNKRSAPPMNLEALEGSGWRPENGFSFNWGVPPGQVSPIIGAVYLMRDAGNDAQVGSGYFQGSDVESGGPVDVPDVGEFKVVVYLVDAALNLGDPAEVTIRFDDRPPGNVAPLPAPGWISNDELPIQQEVERAEAGGPSGVSGYALSVSKEAPAPPCETIICLAPEITLSGGPNLRTGSIGGLSEGSHWIAAAAVSGASKSSLEPGSTMVQVDKTPPESEISGVPGTWVNHPVTVVVHATDQLSGMVPEPASDDGQPATFVDAESYATYESPGSVATFSIATEGVSKVRYWAEDLAGNANDGEPGPGGDSHPNPGQAVIRIDTVPPEAAFESARDPEDPELVWVDVSDPDSGVSDVEIQIRRAGSSGEFSSLPTEEENGRFKARIPSDDLDAAAYELRARVSDRAGNQTTAGRTEGGEPMILNLPLKSQPELTATFQKGRTSVRATYDGKEFVEGRLVSEGLPMTNQVLSITETFATGSRQESRVTEVRTDGDGWYRSAIAGGPTRQVQVSFAGTRKVSKASSSLLALTVRGSVKLRMKPRKIRNGGVVRMSGSVGFRGALPPARGKLVAIQFFDPSRRKWRPVEVLRTNSKGRFRYRYRFRTITSAQKIIFRAASLPEAGWPYLPSTSKPKSVIVYPKG